MGDALEAELDLNLLLSVAGGLGRWRELDGGARRVYAKDDDCLACLKDLQRFLRRDDPEARCAFLKLGELRLVQTDLLPLLLGHHGDTELVYNTLKVLTFMTMPCVPDKHNLDLARQLAVLADVKACCCSRDLLAVLVALAAGPLGRFPRLTETDAQMLQLLLTFLRNLLTIADPLPSGGGADTGRASLQDELLAALLDEAALDVAAFVAANISHRCFKHDAALVVGLLAAVVQGIDAGDVACASEAAVAAAQRHADQAAAAAARHAARGRKTRAQQLLQATAGTTRNGRFNPTLVVTHPDSGPAFVTGVAALSGGSLPPLGFEMETKVRPPPPRRPSPTLLLALQRFTQQLLAGPLNEAMGLAFKDLQSGVGVMADAEDFAAWMALAAWMGRYVRLQQERVHEAQQQQPPQQQLQQQPSASSAAAAAAAAGGASAAAGTGAAAAAAAAAAEPPRVSPFGGLAATVTREALHVARVAFKDQSELPPKAQDKSWPLLHAAASFLREALGLLELAMRAACDEADRRSAERLARQLLHDTTSEAGLLPALARRIKTFSAAHEPRAAAGVLVEALHALLRLYDRLSTRDGGLFRVVKAARRGGGRRKKAPAPGTEDAAEPAAAAAAGAAEGQGDAGIAAEAAGAAAAATAGGDGAAAGAAAEGGAEAAAGKEGQRPQPGAGDAAAEQQASATVPGAPSSQQQQLATAAEALAAGADCPAGKDGAAAAASSQEQQQQHAAAGDQPSSALAPAEPAAAAEQAGGSGGTAGLPAQQGAGSRAASPAPEPGTPGAAGAGGSQPAAKPPQPAASGAGGDAAAAAGVGPDELAEQDDGGEGYGSGSGSDDDEDGPARTREVVLDLRRELRTHLAAPAVVALYTWLLAGYACGNSAALNRAVVSFLWRLVLPEQLGLEPLLYQLSILRLFHQLLSDASLRGSKEHTQVLALATRVVRGLFAKLAPPPLEQQPQQAGAAGAPPGEDEAEGGGGGAPAAAREARRRAAVSGMVAVELLFWKHPNVCDLISAEYHLHDTDRLAGVAGGRRRGRAPGPRAAKPLLNPAGEERLRRKFEALAADRSNLDRIVEQLGGRLDAKQVSRELRRLGLKFGQLPPWLEPRLRELFEEYKGAAAEGDKGDLAVLCGLVAQKLPGGWTEAQAKRLLQAQGLLPGGRGRGGAGARGGRVRGRGRGGAGAGNDSSSEDDDAWDTGCGGSVLPGVERALLEQLLAEHGSDGAGLEQIAAQLPESAVRDTLATAADVEATLRHHGLLGGGARKKQQRGAGGGGGRRRAGAGADAMRIDKQTLVQALKDCSHFKNAGDRHNVVAMYLNASVLEVQRLIVKYRLDTDPDGCDSDGSGASSDDEGAASHASSNSASDSGASDGAGSGDEAAAGRDRGRLAGRRAQQRPPVSAERLRQLFEAHAPAAARARAGSGAGEGQEQGDEAGAEAATQQEQEQEVWLDAIAAELPVPTSSGQVLAWLQRAELVPGAPAGATGGRTGAAAGAARKRRRGPRQLAASDDPDGAPGPELLDAADAPGADGGRAARLAAAVARGPPAGAAVSGSVSEPQPTQLLGYLQGLEDAHMAEGGKWMGGAGAVRWLLGKLDAAEAVWALAGPPPPGAGAGASYSHALPDYSLVPSGDADVAFFCSEFSNELLEAAGVRNDDGDYFKIPGNSSAAWRDRVRAALRAALDKLGSSEAQAAADVVREEAAAAAAARAAADEAAAAAEQARLEQAAAGVGFGRRAGAKARGGKQQQQPRRRQQQQQQQQQQRWCAPGGEGGKRRRGTAAAGSSDDGWASGSSSGDELDVQRPQQQQQQQQRQAKRGRRQPAAATAAADGSDSPGSGSAGPGASAGAASPGAAPRSSIGQAQASQEHAGPLPGSEELWALKHSEDLVQLQHSEEFGAQAAAAAGDAPPQAGRKRRSGGTGPAPDGGDGSGKKQRASAGEGSEAGTSRRSALQEITRRRQQQQQEQEQQQQAVPHKPRLARLARAGSEAENAAAGGPSAEPALDDGDGLLLPAAAGADAAARRGGRGALLLLDDEDDD